MFPRLGPKISALPKADMEVLRPFSLMVLLFSIVQERSTSLSRLNLSLPRHTLGLIRRIATR